MDRRESVRCCARTNPGDRVRLKNDVPKYYPLNYGANVGVWFVFDPETSKGGPGAFYPNSKLKSGKFSDGMSKTIAFAEVKAWNPYFRNAALNEPQPVAPDTVASLGGDFKTNSGHTESLDGRAHQTGVTGLFAPNTKVLYENADGQFDVDWSNQQEGKSASVATFAAVTSRSHHGGGVNIVRMDGFRGVHGKRHRCACLASDVHPQWRRGDGISAMISRAAYS